MRIGYYAHHHGSGHCRQADKLAALLPIELRPNFLVFTSLTPDIYQFTAVADEQIIRLSPEDERADEVLSGRVGPLWHPECSHYSPVGNSDIQTRSWQILTGIKDHKIDLMIIDVSAEVAMLCRASSVPYLYVRLAGIRDDAPHLNAFAGALGLIAPYPKSLEAAETPDWLQQKTLYLDFLSSQSSESIPYDEFIDSLKILIDDDKNDYDNINTPKLDLKYTLKNNKSEQVTKIITVIKGYGGHEAIDTKLPELRAIEPDALIISLGPVADDKRAYVDIATEVSDVTPFIAHSDLLIMACGLNNIAQAYPHQTPLVVLPDKRPYREQEVMAQALIAQGRALNWSCFIEQYKSSSSNDDLLSLTVQSRAKQKLNVTNDKAVAQAFMNSLAEYTTIKAWFYDWLLPQLGIAPEC